MSTAAQKVAQEIKDIQAKLKELKANVLKFVQKDSKLSVQIGAKGTINIYGLGRYPVCLYMSQAVKLQKLLNDPEFQKFIVDNQAQLATKKEEKEA